MQCKCATRMHDKRPENLGEQPVKWPWLLGTDVQQCSQVVFKFMPKRFNRIYWMKLEIFEGYPWKDLCRLVEIYDNVKIGINYDGTNRECQDCSRTF